MLILFILLCEAVGVVGGLFTGNSVKTWYTTIHKPSFNPPGWVFGPVWTVLYLLMGIAMYLVYRHTGSPSKTALWFFGVHLVVNLLWSIIFFGAHRIGLALAEIVVMWAMIAVSIYLFWKIDQRAALLLVPYLLWVTFATFLNYSIWRLNA